MKVLLKKGRPGTWYEKEQGKEFEVEETENGYGDHQVTGCDDGYNRWINKHDFKIVSNETERNHIKQA